MMRCTVSAKATADLLPMIVSTRPYSAIGSDSKAMIASPVSVLTLACS